MSFEAAKCPTCGWSIQVPTDREKARCMYCGNELSVKEAIQKLKVELNGPIVVDTNIETILRSANGFLKLEKWDDARKLFEKVIEQDSTDYRGWWGKFLVKSKNMTLSPKKLEYTDDPRMCDASDAQSAIKMAPQTVMAQLYKQYNEYVQKVPKTCIFSIYREVKYPKMIVWGCYVNEAYLGKFIGGENIIAELIEGQYVVRVVVEFSGFGQETTIAIDSDCTLTVKPRPWKGGLDFKITDGGMIL